MLVGAWCLGFIVFLPTIITISRNIYPPNTEENQVIYSYRKIRKFINCRVYVERRENNENAGAQGLADPVG